jgi:flagellar basal-body rod protein FlgG
MNGAFYIGATGLRAQQQALEITANNIANMNTAAYKRSGVQFSELISQTGKTDAQGAAWNLAATLSGVSAQAGPHIFTQGSLQQTGQAMDVAVNGDGFFEVMGPSGQTMLWRGGTLQVNSEGRLAAANGMALKAMISIPAGAGPLTIGADGTVQAVLAGDSKSTVLGKIDLALVRDPAALSDLGGGLFEASDDHDLTIAPPGQDGAGLLAQGALEGSNVQLTDEMTAMLITQRAFGAAAQIVQAGDQLMSIANSLRR